jgi:hypothetical protein
VNRKICQFPLRRLFIATFWFAFAAFAFTEFVRTGRDNGFLVFAVFATVGAGVGAIAGRAFYGALIAVLILAILATTCGRVRE